MERQLEGLWREHDSTEQELQELLMEKQRQTQQSEAQIAVLRQENAELRRATAAPSVAGSTRAHGMRHAEINEAPIGVTHGPSSPTATYKPQHQTPIPPNHRGKGWSTMNIVHELQRRIQIGTSKAFDQSRQAWGMFGRTPIITTEVLRKQCQKYDLLLDDKQVLDLYNYLDTDGNGEVDFVEFCSNLMGEAYHPKRHAMSWLKDVEISDKKKRDAAQKQMREAGSLAHACSRKEQPNWMKSGKLKPNLVQILMQVQQKVVQKTAKDSDLLRSAFCMLGGSKDPIDEKKFKHTLHVLGVVVDDAQALELFELIDTDHSGAIDFYEFITGIMPTDYGASSFSTVPVQMQQNMQERSSRQMEQEREWQEAPPLSKAQAALIEFGRSHDAQRPPPVDTSRQGQEEKPREGRRVKGATQGRDRPAFEAVKQGDIEALAMLVVKAQGGPMSAEALGVRNMGGQTPLHLAAQIGNPDVVKWMLQVEPQGRPGAQVGGLLFSVDNAGLTPAQTAQHHGRVLAARLLKKAEKKALRVTCGGARSPSPSRGNALSPSPSRGGVLSPLPSRGGASSQGLLPSPSRINTAEVKPFAGRASASISGAPRSPTKLPKLGMPGHRSLSPPPPVSKSTVWSRG